jgi:hypothetical protein
MFLTIIAQLLFSIAIKIESSQAPFTISPFVSKVVSTAKCCVQLLQCTNTGAILRNVTALANALY